MDDITRIITQGTAAEQIGAGLVDVDAEALCGGCGGAGCESCGGRGWAQ